MNPLKKDNLPTIVYFAIGCLICLGIILGILLVFKLVRNLIPIFGILVPLGLLALTIIFLKVTKK